MATIPPFPGAPLPVPFVPTQPPLTPPNPLVPASPRTVTGSLFASGMHIEQGSHIEVTGIAPGDVHLALPVGSYSRSVSTALQALDAIDDLIFTQGPHSDGQVSTIDDTCQVQAVPSLDYVNLVFVIAPSIDAGPLQTWLSGHLAYSTAFAQAVVINQFNAAVYGPGGLAALYNAQATALNNNAAVQDPVGFANAQATAALAAINNAVAGALALANATATTVTNAVNALKTGTVDPAVANAQTLIAQQQAFVLAQVEALRILALATVNGAVATITAAKTTIDAEIAKQQAAAEALVTQAVADAMARVAGAILLVGQVQAQVQAEVNRITIEVLAEGARVLAQAQSLLADRPLYYGALASPITVTATTDVIVIPPGGLTITAN